MAGTAKAAGTGTFIAGGTKIHTKMNLPDTANQQSDPSGEEKRPVREKQWVNSFADRLREDLARHGTAEARIDIADGQKLPYLCQIYEYSQDTAISPIISSYETDLLIKEQLPDGRWIPRVVVECKLGHINTHDSLTYSAKAATHKHVHPYLRYGILIGDHARKALPGRLIRHGAYFDFMLSWAGAQPSDEEWKVVCHVVGKEIIASRTLQELLTTSRVAARRKITVLHRPLEVLTDEKI
jgi:hypothetical protein